MDIVINLLIFVHIVAFVVGGANSVVGPVIGARMASASPDQRTGYVGVMTTLGQTGKIALATLLITGPLVMFLKYGGFGGASIWFWIKMALVALLLACVIYGGVLFKKSLAGDKMAGQRAGMVRQVSSLAFLGVLLSAVFAFN